MKDKKKILLLGLIGVVILVGLYFSPMNYKKLNVPNYNQIKLGIPEGCEGVSLLEGLHYKKEALDEKPVEFLDKIPRSSSPYEGFAGNPFVTQRHVFSAIYDKPLTQWASNFGKVENISGAAPKKLYQQVEQGNPVIVWVTIHFEPLRNMQWNFGEAPANNHAVLLAGYNNLLNRVYVSDPIDGKYWLSKSEFEHIYHQRKMAVVVK